MSAGHNQHPGHSGEMFRRKFWGALLIVALNAQLLRRAHP
jgi:hypothetical protein